MFLLVVVFRQTKIFYSLRPLRLCGNILNESFFSPNLASFASLQLAPWNNAVNEKITLLWNTASTEVELFANSTIPQGESSFPDEAIGYAVGRSYHALRMYHIIPSGKVGRSMELTLLKST